MKLAEFSECGKYRYVLRRRIPQNVRWVKPCLFIMLNPSTADEVKLDPTVTRCYKFAESWGCTELTVVNLFGLRATDPKKLYTAKDPYGPKNLRYVLEEIEKHQNLGMIIAAWGAHKIAEPISNFPKTMASNLLCLGKTKSGAPRHPLYIPSKTVPIPFGEDC